MRIKTIVPSLMLATALSACSVFEPDYYNCDDKVTSYAQGARSSLVTTQNAQNVEVRLNGVSGQCYDEAAGVNTELAIGLKVSRDLEEGAEVDPVLVPMVAAIISADETVLETVSFAYTMQFISGAETIYPLVRREFTVPKGGRVILSLTPELLGQNDDS